MSQGTDSQEDNQKNETEFDQCPNCGGSVALKGGKEVCGSCGLCLSC